MTKTLLSIFLLLLGLSTTFYGQRVQEIRQNLYDQKFESAADNSHNLLKADPANAEGWYLLTLAYLELDKADKASDTLSLAPADASKDPLYKVAKGSILMKKNKRDSARVLFDKVLDETKQKNPVVLAAIARSVVDSKSGDARFAIDLLNNAIKRDKNNPELFTLLGDAWRKAGSGEEAYKAYQIAIQKDEKHAAALYRLGKIFVTQKNPQQYLIYFNRALEADPTYLPALYELYYHYYFTDPAKALEYFEKYRSLSDASSTNEYLYADLLFLNKQYLPAIDKAKAFMQHTPPGSNPRLYKLMGYCYLGLKDSSAALDNFLLCRTNEADSNLSVKDYETIGALYMTRKGKEDSAAVYYELAAANVKDSNTRYDYYKKLADLNKATKNYSGEAHWLGKFYTNNAKAGNVDLFNWGVAHYRAAEYQLADSVFGMYINKHPEQAYGYYWRARTNSLIDTAMQSGAAVPYYNELISIIEKDSTNKTYRKWLVEAYGYLAAYETNKEKNYESAIGYLKKVLAIDPENKDAKEYIQVLEKSIGSKQQN